MQSQIMTTVVAGAGFAIAAVCAYLHLRHRLRWGLPLLRIAVTVAMVLNTVYLVRNINQFGLVEAFRQSFTSTVLLATLIGLIGIGTHLTSALRGIDGFLFIFAAVIEWAALAVMHRQSGDFLDRPWFISHSLAFALSAACWLAGGAAGVAYLLIHSLLRRKKASTLLGHAPPLEALERFGRWMLMIGFPLFTYGILTGICGVAHTEDPVPGEWLRDPFIAFSLITWVVYAVMVLAVWFRPELRGRRAAKLATCGVGFIVIGFLVLELISPLH